MSIMARIIPGPLAGWQPPAAALKPERNNIAAEAGSYENEAAGTSASTPRKLPSLITPASTAIAELVGIVRVLINQVGNGYEGPYTPSAGYFTQPAGKLIYLNRNGDKFIYIDGEYFPFIYGAVHSSAADETFKGKTGTISIGRLRYKIYLLDSMLQNPITCSWRAIFILMSGILPSLTSDGEGIIGKSGAGEAPALTCSVSVLFARPKANSAVSIPFLMLRFTSAGMSIVISL